MGQFPSKPPDVSFLEKKEATDNVTAEALA